MFHNTKLEMLTSAKHSNLLVQFVSSEENEVLWLFTQVPDLIIVGKMLTAKAKLPGGHASRSETRELTMHKSELGFKRVL